MRIVTIGSRICDDAVISQKVKQHDNVLRITGISPFSLRYDSFCADLSLKKVVETNLYYKKILKFDADKTLLKEACKKRPDMYVFDFLDAACNIIEYVFSDGQTIRFTTGDTFLKNEDYIRQYFEKLAGTAIKERRILEPLQWTQQRLEDEIRAYAEKITQFCGKDAKIVLIDSMDAFQYIQSDGTISHVEDLSEIISLNVFYERCAVYFRKYINCNVIPSVDKMLASEKYRKSNKHHFTPVYFDYINACLNMLSEKTDIKKTMNHIAGKYENDMQELVDTLLLPDLVNRLEYIRNGRQVILIGGTARHAEILVNEYKIPVFEFIEYHQNSNSAIEKSIEEIKGKQESYVLLILHLYQQDQLLKLLFQAGYMYSRDMVLPNSESVSRICSVTGKYKDIYNNKFEIQTPVQIDFEGAGSVLKIDKSNSNLYMVKMYIDSQNIAKIGEEVSANRMLSIGLKVGCELVIGEHTTFADGCKIVFTNECAHIEIGKDCMFSTKILMVTGVDEVIPDRKIGWRVNNLSEKTEMCEKSWIRLQEHVWIGYQAVIMSGADIASGSIVGARAMVNKKFPNNCIIAGNPAKIVKKDIAWQRDPFTGNIYDNPELIEEQYLKFTVEEPYCKTAN